MKRNQILVLLILAVLALASVLLAVLNPELEWQTDMGSTLLDPSLQHLFGTDSLGRDIFVRTLFGARFSLLLGFVAGVAALIMGTVYGLIAGWLGGFWDNILMRIVEILQSLPQLVLLCLVMMYLQLRVPDFSKSLFGIALLLSSVSWMSFARLARSLVLREKILPYIESAKALGASPSRIIVRHLLPNILSPLLVLMGAQLPHFLLFESSLSFFGLGVQPPQASWGVLIYEGWRQFSGYPHLLLLPALTLFLTSLALNSVFFTHKS